MKAVNRCAALSLGLAATSAALVAADAAAQQVPAVNKRFAAASASATMCSDIGSNLPVDYSAKAMVGIGAASP